MTVTTQPNAPMSLEAEEALLGSILLDPETFLAVSPIVKGSDFFLKKHEILFLTIGGMIHRKEPVDFVTLTKELETLSLLNEIGGSAYLTRIVNSTPTSVNAEIYAELVSRVSIRRKMIQASEEIRRAAFNEEITINDAIAEAEQSILSIKPSRERRELVSLYQALSDYYDVIEKMRHTDERHSGVPTGYEDVDNLIGGLQKSDFIVCAGRTGMGKTSWLLSTALNVARKGGAVAIFTLEMSVEQLVQRLISMETGITIQQLRRGAINDTEMDKFIDIAGRLANLPIYIDDTPAITSATMTMRSRRLKHESKLDMVVVDYIQLMSGGSKFNSANREREVASISRSLKEMARELNVTVLAAAQLNRAVEYRTDKRPMLSDLRESGSIEQDADAVMFLYREDYYLGEASEFPGMVELNLAKHRHGPTGVARLFFNKNTTKFSNASKNTMDTDIITGDF